MTDPPTTLTRERSGWLAVGLLLVLFAQLATSSAVKSPVFDEPLHTARAYYVMATGNWDMQAGHLPLLYRLIGPLFWTLPQRPPVRHLTGSADHVAMAREIIRLLDYPWGALIYPLRIMVIGSTLLLGAILYRWAGERHGTWGSLLALFAYTFSPNILAHGRLVTTDLLLTLLFFLAVYTFQRLLRRPTIIRCLTAGLSLGLALGAKASAPLLLPILSVVALVRSTALGDRSSKGQDDRRGWLGRYLYHTAWLAVTTLVAGGVLWLLYELDAGPWFDGWPALPLPSYVKTMLQVVEHGGERGHPAFLMGQRSGGGWRAYFPIALALKTPLPTLIAAPAGAAWLLLQKRWRTCLTACVPALVFLAAASLSSLNIGYRHILPVLPFLILLLSSLGELPWHSWGVAVAGGGLALWLVAGTLQIYPDHLAYFNALAGGARGGHRYLTDSNLDWGQDLIQLRDYLERHGIKQVYLSYFGNVNPRAYGIEYEPLPSHFPIGVVEDFTPFSPAPGFYAVSVTNLSGQYLIENPSVLDWFNHQEPIASVGHSINIYRVVVDPSPPSWVGVCEAPGAPLDEETFAHGLGRDDTRFVRFDCRSSWVFANEGDPAWFVVPATDETDRVVPPAGSWLTTYEQENYDGKLLFTIYRWEGQDELQAYLETVQTPSAYPNRVGEVLRFLGYEMSPVRDIQTEPSIRLTTYWHVLAQPDRPLSLMVHLVDRENGVTAVGDALGIPAESWAPGDILVQEHRLAPQPATALEHCHVELGAYWLPSLKPLPILDQTGAPLAGDVIRLPTIESGAAQ